MATGLLTAAAWAPSLVLAEAVAYVGHYQAAPASIHSEVSAWGPNCGAQPQSYAASERPMVVVSAAGAHLVLGFPDRTLRTDTCWSPNPIVKLATATAADNRWRTECRTPRALPKREVGRYTVTTAGAYTLELLEESDYDWQLDGSRCVATVRIVQRLERLATERTAAPQSAPQPPVEDAAKASACVAGPAVRLRIRPSEVRLEPAQRVCFTVEGIDAVGCASDADVDSVRWELKKPDAARAQLAGGCFKAAPSAADAEGTFGVKATREKLRAEARVTVVAADLSDITARRAPMLPAPHPRSPPGAAKSLLDARMQAAAVKRNSSLTQWLLFGAAGVASFGAGLMLLRRRRRRPAFAPGRVSVPPSQAPRDAVARPSFVPGSIPSRAPWGAPETSVPPMAVGVTPESGPTEPMICPQCRRGYAPGALDCEGDGASLVPYAEFLRRATAAGRATQPCPGCGASLAPGSIFCGACGGRLTS